MRLFSPGALWVLFLVPLLILMYILKQRFEEREVSSLYLWNQVLMDSEATTPFQKFRNNLLFFLQLLAILLFIFALTNPFIWWKDKNYENLVMVIDTTGSMSALSEDGEKNIDKAKKKAEELINSISSGSKITLIASGRNSSVEITASTDKKEVINKIKNIKETNSAGNIDEAYSLVHAICSQYDSYKVVYYTDRAVDLKELNGEVQGFVSKKNNVSLDYIADGKTEKGLKVMIRVTNHGGENTKIELCLYGEDKLIDIKNVELLKGETKTIYFDNVPEDKKYIYGEITEKDALLEDNVIYDLIKQSETKKILLSTDQNVFLEKAIGTLKGVELFRTPPGEKITGDYDLYIFDGSAPKDLPKKGNILFVNQKENNSLFNIKAETEGGKTSILPHSITKYMGNDNFVISKIREVETPIWGSNLLKIIDKNIAFAGEFKGQKIGAVGFDFHNSDFPLTLQFPIFINNFISYLIDRDVIGNTKFNCGDSIDIVPLPEAEKIFITNPLKEKVEQSIKYPIKPFDKAFIPGIYTVTQKLSDKEESKLIAVNFPSSESNLSFEQNNSTKINTEGTSRGGINIREFLLLLVFGLIIGEWIMYLRS